MMTVHFMPMEVTTYLHCRRGRSTFRKVRIDIGMKEAIYNALPQSSLEVVDATGHVWSRADVRENRGKLILDYQGPPTATFDPIAFAKQKAKNEGTIASEPDQRPETKGDNDLQRMGGEHSEDGQTIRRPVHVQIPLVGAVDARFECTEERGAESSPDGLHGSNDEQDILDD